MYLQRAVLPCAESQGILAVVVMYCCEPLRRLVAAVMPCHGSRDYENPLMVIGGFQKMIYQRLTI